VTRTKAFAPKTRPLSDRTLNRFLLWLVFTAGMRAKTDKSDDQQHNDEGYELNHGKPVCVQTSLFLRRVLFVFLLPILLAVHSHDDGSNNVASGAGVSFPYEVSTRLIILPRNFGLCVGTSGPGSPAQRSSARATK